MPFTLIEAFKPDSIRDRVFVLLSIPAYEWIVIGLEGFRVRPHMELCAKLLPSNI